MLRTAGVEKRVSLNVVFAAIGKTRFCQARHIDVESGELSSHGLAIAILGESQDIPCGGFK
jgi:hypothetical protein